MTLLSEQHCQIDLLQALTVPVVSVLEILIELAVRGNRGDVVAEVVILHYPTTPSLKEGLLSIGVQAPQNIAYALAA